MPDSLNSDCWKRSAFWSGPTKSVRLVCILWCFVILNSFSLQINAQKLVVPEADRIHFGDVIDVDVVGGFEFDWRGKIDPEGFLDGLTTYGEPVRGLCRTDSELEVSIASALSKVLRDPKVVVRIVDRSGRAVVTLDGAVRSPYRFQMRRPTRLRELIVLSGGISDDASGEIQIFRPKDLNCFEQVELKASDGKSIREPAAAEALSLKIVSVSELLRGSSDADPWIRSGDLINVLKASPVYVIGGVNAPGPIMSRPSLTLSRAVAMAGGISKEAQKTPITIYRREGGLTTIINADIDQISAGTADDTIIKPLDIIDVPQRNKPKRSFPPTVVGTSGSQRPSSLPLRIIE